MHLLRILALIATVFGAGLASPVPTTPQAASVSDLSTRTRLHLMLLSSDIQTTLLNYVTVRQPQRGDLPVNKDVGLVTMCNGPGSTLMLIGAGDYITVFHRHACILRAFDYLLDTILEDERISSWTRSFESQVRALQNKLLTTRGLLNDWVDILQPSSPSTTSAPSPVMTRPPYIPRPDRATLVLRDYAILASLKDAINTLLRDVEAISERTAK